MVDFRKLGKIVPPPPVPDDFLTFPGTWAKALAPVRGEVWFRELAKFLREERAASPPLILPPDGLELEALRLTDLENVRVVMVAQDPYPHDAACGLAFSVAEGQPVPQSARAILSELERDGFSLPPPRTFDLRPWAARGVLLLNATLTVRRNAPKSHANRGWEQLTSAILRAIRDRDAKRWAAHWRDPNSTAPPPVPAIFLSLGSWARDLLSGSASSILVPSDVHVTAPHPAARDGSFSGSRPFFRTNLYLSQFGGAPMDWSLHRAVPPEEAVEALRTLWKALAPSDALSPSGISPAQEKALALAREALATAREAVTLSGKLLRSPTAEGSVEDLRERVRDLARAIRTRLEYYRSLTEGHGR